MRNYRKTSLPGYLTLKAINPISIATFTWMLFYKENTNPKKAAILREMVEYGLTEGQKISAKMGYIPLPENVVTAVCANVDKIQ